MIAFPNVKINIGLRVKSKRKDGFHEIETILYPVAWCDLLEIMPAGSQAPADSIRLSGLPLSCDLQDNLVERAHRLFNHIHQTERRYIHLHKQIPPGAGLGGGSSDAAFTLKMLAVLSGKKIALHHLRNMAAHLGSDCAFFIDNIPALATGRGEMLTPVENRLNNFFVVILKPDIHISTAWAYAHVQPSEPVIPLIKLYAYRITDWRKLIFNDFEDAVFAAYPVIGEMKKYLYSLGAVYASLSGSGSAVYGIFEKPVNIKKYRPDDLLWSGRFNELPDGKAPVQ
jgi:4-diphosphocytidyl-2-C-methyl-D-erythritol kinase